MKRRYPFFSNISPAMKAVTGGILLSMSAAILTVSVASAQQEKQFVALDVNKDGAIDQSEFRRARLRDFTTIDSNRDGSLSRTEFVDRDAGGRFTLRALRARRFLDMDKNGDGKVSRREYIVFGNIVFARVDQNGDRRVVRAEFLNPRRAPSATTADDGTAPPPPGARRGGGSGSDPRRGAFTSLDINGDGVITAAELDAARRKAFNELDSDNDGKLSAAEAITRMGRSAARRFAQLDTNKDGVVIIDEYLVAGRAVLARSDRNQDGQVTWPEFKATTPLR